MTDTTRTIQDAPIDRREFFRRLGRYSVLGGVAAGGVFVGRRGVDRTRQICVNKGVCCGCGEFERCRLPAALSEKGRQSAP